MDIESGYTADEPADDALEAEDRQPIDALAEYLEAPNVADLLDNEKLATIGEKVIREYRIDKSSRSEWEERNREAMDLAMQVTEVKNYPWPNAANVKFPLLTTAAIQFAARAYPAVVSGSAVVRAKVVGKDEDGSKRARGERIATHMSWQVIEDMVDWEADTDKLLHIVPIAGMAYRKTFFDPILGKNRSQLATADRVVVNDNATDLETVPRITQEVDFYPYEIEERFRSGIFKKAELGLTAGEDDDAPHMFLEQHRTLDLDDDGYAEPYIVTCHFDTSKVVRIVANFEADGIALNEAGEIARIEKIHYFTKFGMMPNPSGGFHDIGFGYLLGPINEAVNTTLNQLLDAGHLANLGGGFIGSGARLRGGQAKFRPGEWKAVNTTGTSLAQNLVPLPVREPSIVLFQLLGLLIEAGKDISAVKDVMTGTAPAGNTPATTTLALIEQGMQVFSAIYKRIFRSLKAEYKKLYRLNGQYLQDEEYFQVLDEEQAVRREDYDANDLDIVPVADPNVVTNMQKLARAEFLMQFVGDPHFDGMKIRRRMLEAASIDDVEDLMVQEQPPDMALMAKADEIDLKKSEIAIKERELSLREVELGSEIQKRMAETLKLIAEAEAAEAGPQIQAYAALMGQLNARAQIMLEGAKDDGGGVPRLEAPPGDAAVPQVPPGAP